MHQFYQLSYVTLLHFQITHSDYLHLLFWQFTYVIDAIVPKHLRHLVNIWHDVFYLILPISLNEKWNSIAGLYSVMKLYLLQKNNSNTNQEEMTSSFTNFKKWSCQHVLGKHLLCYIIFCLKLMLVSPKSLISFSFQCRF